MSAACGGLEHYLCPEGTGDPGLYAAVVYVYAADILLEDGTQPTFGGVEGELASASTVHGTASVIFKAQDADSGVYEAIASVDGSQVGATVLDSNGGHCVNVGQTGDGLPAFLYEQPCAHEVGADVPLDTTSLSDGEHHLVVSVTDAAGNSTVVLDRKIDVANPLPSSSGQTSPTSTVGSAGGSSGSSQSGSSGGSSAGATGSPNGVPASAQAVLSARWTATAKSKLTGRFGRAQTIVGRLTGAGGAPIAGAAIEVLATPAGQGARASTIAEPNTRADGRFSVRLPAHADSERIVLGYRVHLGDPAPVAVRTLTLSVPASLSLGVAPRVSHVGGTIVFAGVLHGGSIPPGGKQLVLQAQAPRSGWRTFDVLSTDRRGRYRASYRFRLPGPIVYRFRAVSRQEADFPFATGSSNVVAVRER